MLKAIEVRWDKRVEKSLAKIPAYLRDKFMAWVLVVERIGLFEVRKLPAYHDELLKGDRKGQRSIRLNRAYRAIYVVHRTGQMQVVEILEVSKHEY